MINRRLTLTQRRALPGIFFILPWLIGFVFLFLTPLIESVRFSFSVLQVTPDGFTLAFNGIENFRVALAVDPEFNRVLTQSVLEMVYDVPMILFFSLFTATLLNQKFRGRSVARAIFFLPVILASGAVEAAQVSGLIQLTGSAEAAQELEQQQMGFDPMMVVRMLGNAGIPLWFVEYIAEAITRIYEIISSSGVQILIFLAALQSVPSSMYEVAKIDGATAYESFWKITFPMVSPLILTNVIYTIIDSFADSPVTQRIYQTAFVSQNFGLSAAMAWLYTIAVSLLLIIIGYLISKRVFYYN